MKYFVIAGEASGDLHASHLVQQIKTLDKDAEFVGWGGDLLIKQGAIIKKHIRELAFMGFVEVVKNLSTIRRNFKLCKEQILEYKPDIILYVDYPGFNFRIVKWAKKQGFNNQYFISPNVWAWKAKRVFTVRDYIDKMYVILPFEKEFYAKYGIEVDYFGNPLVDIVKNYKPKPIDEFRANNKLEDKPIIALMAGSRRTEIKNMLPIMLQVADKFPMYNFIIAGAPAIDEEFYNSIIGDNKNVKLLFGQNYEILSHSIAGLITSGTATLETALFKLPQVVCYKADSVSVAIARLLANVKYISLVNLILDKEAVKELIQKDLTIENLTDEFLKILPKGERNEQITQDNIELYNLLDNPDIYNNIAKEIVQTKS